MILKVGMGILLGAAIGYGVNFLSTHLGMN
jgi:hypothetical protein